MMAIDDLAPAFTVSEARSGGLSIYAMKSPDLERPFWGVRATSQASREDSLRALLRRLPVYAFLIGFSAAQVSGWPLPWRDRDRGTSKPSVGVPAGKAQIRQRGVESRRIGVDVEEIVMVNGFRVPAPARTWLDLSARLGEEDLVALTDYLLHPASPWVTLEELEDICCRLPKAPGARARRNALALCDPAAESPMESKVRVRLIRAGLPRPECNPTLVLSSGRVVRPDMLWRDQKFIAEYNGGYHHTEAQFRADESRLSDLRYDGYEVIVINRDDLGSLGEVAGRIRKKFDSRS